MKAVCGVNNVIFPAKQAWFIIELYTPEHNPDACYTSNITAQVDSLDDVSICLDSKSILTAQLDVLAETHKSMIDPSSSLTKEQESITDLNHTCRGEK